MVDALDVGWWGVGGEGGLGGVWGSIRVIPDRFGRFLVDLSLIRVILDRFGRFSVDLIDGGCTAGMPGCRCGTYSA